MAAPSKWKSTVGLAKGTCPAHGQLLWNLQMHFSAILLVDYIPKWWLPGP